MKKLGFAKLILKIINISIDVKKLVKLKLTILLKHAMPALQPFLLAVAARRSEVPDAGASAGTTAVLAHLPQTASLPNLSFARRRCRR